MHLPTFCVSVCYRISELVVVSGSLCSILSFINVSNSFLEPFKLFHPLGKVSYTIIITLHVIFLQQENSSPQKLIWQMRSSKSDSIPPLHLCRFCYLLFWLNDQNCTQYLGCNCTVDGIMVFPVLASVPFLTLLKFCLLFDYPWA